MKLLVAAQNWPHRGHTRLSANIVVFELIREFARASDRAVAFVCTPRADWDAAPADEAAARRDHLAGEPRRGRMRDRLVDVQHIELVAPGALRQARGRRARAEAGGPLFAADVFETRGQA